MSGGGIVRVEHDRERPYVVVSKGLSEDKRASFALRGMLVYLLGKPPGWSAQMAEIEAASAAPGKDGREAIRGLFKEGRALGYIKTVETREKGRVAYSHTIYETPLVPPVPQIVTVDGLPSAVSRLRSAVNGQPSTATRRLISNEEVSNEEVSNKPPPTPQGGATGEQGQEAGDPGEPNPPTPSQVTSDGGQGGETKRSRGSAKGSAGRAAPFDPLTLELPETVPAELWAAWCAYRAKSKHKAVNEEGGRLTLKRLDMAARNGWDLWEMLEDAQAGQWQGIVYEKHKHPRPGATKPGAALARPGADRTPRRDLTTQEAVTRASANAAAMLDYLED